MELCWNCKAKGHIIRNCNSKVRCRISDCNKQHHTLLHENTASVSHLNKIKIKNTWEVWDLDINYQILEVVHKCGVLEQFRLKKSHLRNH